MQYIWIRDQIRFSFSFYTVIAKSLVNFSYNFFKIAMSLFSDVGSTVSYPFNSVLFVAFYCQVKYGDRSPKFIQAPCDVHSFTHWLSPPNSPHLDSYYEGAIGQQRQTTSLSNPLTVAQQGTMYTEQVHELHSAHTPLLYLQDK